MPSIAHNLEGDAQEPLGTVAVINSLMAIKVRSRPVQLDARGQDFCVCWHKNPRLHRLFVPRE